jgi:glucose/arabinose dehydrogenase
MSCRSIAVAVLGLGLLLALLDRSSVSAQTVVHDPRFANEVILRGAGMTAIAFAPDGRLYVAQKRGVILTLAPNGTGGFGAATTFLDISGETMSNGESGLLGMALDPSFAQNRYMYLYQVRDNDTRILRVTASTSFTSVSAQLELLAGLPREVEHHKAGEVTFSPSDPNALYIGVGDDGYSSMALMLDRYEGKILRINKADGRGMADNPFYSGSTTTIRSRVWAYGLRNPFRFAFHPSGTPADAMYLSENGDATDRISRVRRGSSGAWSGNEASFLAPSDANHKVLDTQAPTVTGIAIAVGGAFADPAYPTSTTLLVSNGGGQQLGSSGIIRVRLTGTGLDGLASVPNGEPFLTALPFAGAVDMAIGPDGALYYTTCTAGEADGNFELARVSLVAGASPNALFTSSPLRGVAPLTVSFSDASTDGDNDIVSWLWTFGDGTSSTQRNPSHQYAAPGRYTLTLAVTDSAGHTDYTSATVEALRNVTLRISGSVIDGRNLSGAGLGTSTQLRLYDGDTGLPVLLPSGTNIVSVPAGGAFSIQANVQITSAHVVVSAGEPTTDGVQPAFMALAVPANGTIDRQVFFRLSSTALSGRVRDTRGQPAIIDIGVQSGGMAYAIAGGRDTLPTGAYPQTGVAHRIVSDGLGYYYFPLRNTVTTTFAFDMLADTNRELYTGASFSLSIAANQSATRQITVGLINGGRSCDNLSSIPVTSNIDYARDIQPIWNAQCTGCHTASAPNVGGLDLTAGSLARLVGVPSAFVPGANLVTPGQPSRSVLFEKINCADPQHGTRMRPTDAMSLQNQARIRDFILQTNAAARVPTHLPWLLAAGALLALAERLRRRR